MTLSKLPNALISQCHHFRNENNDKDIMRIIKRDIGLVQELNEFVCMVLQVVHRNTPWLYINIHSSRWLWVWVREADCHSSKLKGPEKEARMFSLSEASQRKMLLVALLAPLNYLSPSCVQVTACLSWGSWQVKRNLLGRVCKQDSLAFLMCI